MKKTSALFNNFLKYLNGLIFVVGLYIFFIALFDRSLADYDLWGYLSFGRVFWQEGFFPYQDIFSYTPTKALWVYHEWLTGIVFFGLIKYLGPASLQLLRYILAVLTIYLIYSTAIKRGGNIYSSFMILIPAILLISFGYVPVRAQIFTFFFFILTLFVLETARQTGNVKRLRILPLIQIVWCNLHGGFVAGLGLIFLYALGEGLKRKEMAVSYVKWGLIASLATFINPYGIEYWLYTMDAVSMSRSDITEWYSVFTALKSNIHIFPVVVFLLMSVLIILISLLRKQKDVTELLVIAVVIYLGSVHIRHGVLFGLVFGAYMPLYLTSFAEGWNTKNYAFRRMINFLPVIFLCLLIVIYFYPVQKVNFIPSFKFSVTGDYYPTKAMRWMTTHNIKGNILPHFEWGEYLIWFFYPDCRVAIDGRYETVYQKYVYQEYFDFSYGRDGWNTFLRKYPHDVVLLKARTKTHFLMTHEQDWRLVYQDNTSVIFMRK